MRPVSVLFSGSLLAGVGGQPEGVFIFLWGIDLQKGLHSRRFVYFVVHGPLQWMSNQIDTVGWFIGHGYPRSVAANGGIYMWNDGRSNFDTMTAVFDYGPDDDRNKGFQVVYYSRMHNSTGGLKEIFYSNGGELNLSTNRVTPNGGLQEQHAAAIGMEANLLPEIDLADRQVVTATDAYTGIDDTTTRHTLNWMECVHSRKEPNAPVQVGYEQSIACIMVTAALLTGKAVTFDRLSQEVLADGIPFKY